MAKPASGTPLNTSHALYPNVGPVWAFLEGTGNPQDSKGANHVTALNFVTWSTDSEGAIVVCAGGGDPQRMPITSTVILGSGASWSIAIRGKQTNNDSSGMIMGNWTGSTNFLWWNGGTQFRYRGSSAGDLNFSPTLFTTRANYLLTYDQPNAQAHLYVDGTEVSGSPISAGDGALSIDTLGAGFANAFTLVGSINIVTIWTGRLLTAADATTLHADPYTLFGGGGGGGGALPFITRLDAQRMRQQFVRKCQRYGHDIRNERRVA